MIYSLMLVQVENFFLAYNNSVNHVNTELNKFSEEDASSMSQLKKMEL